MVLQGIINIIIGGIIISWANFVYAGGWSFGSGIVGGLLMWGLTLLYSPSKIKFTPWGRRSFLKLIGFA
jgi:hypothetical protein